MKYDEFAFFNQQLATMLRDGIPLEGALKRLGQEMRAGTLRTELQVLQTDLATGTPLGKALEARQLPDLYKRMIQVGIKSNDLPGALTMLADYYQKQNNTWTRLKGLMVYPVIVLFCAFFISCFLAYILHNFIWNNLEFLSGNQVAPVIAAGLWMAPVLLGMALAVVLVGVAFSPARRKLRWRLPAFREASLAQVAAAMGLMLKNGVALDDALALVQQLEKGTMAEKDIVQWRQRLAAGHKTFSDLAVSNIAVEGAVFPPMFVWTVSQAGEDLPTGFQNAAELYQGRAAYRTELLLYSALPCSVLALAIMIISQISPVFMALTNFIRMLSSGGE